MKPFLLLAFLGLFNMAYADAQNCTSKVKTNISFYYKQDMSINSDISAFAKGKSDLVKSIAKEHFKNYVIDYEAVLAEPKANAKGLIEVTVSYTITMDNDYGAINILMQKAQASGLSFTTYTTEDCRQEIIP